MERPPAPPAAAEAAVCRLLYRFLLAITASHSQEQRVDLNVLTLVVRAVSVKITVKCRRRTTVRASPVIFYLRQRRR